jgi:hypothetical protein
LTIIEHAESFEVRSADGQTVRRFPFDENVQPGERYPGDEEEQALQAARAFAGKGAVLIARATSESSTMPQ